MRLGLLVTGMTYRHPSVYAAEAITIDHASDGRLELAYGAAWFDKEHRELGIPFPPLKERVDAFEEAVQIVRGLLTTDDFTFEGRHFQVHDATLLPAAGAAAAPADLDRRVGREAHDADRGALRRRVALLRGTPRRCAPKSQRLSDDGRGGRPRPGRDHARASSLSLEDDLDTIARTIDDVGDGRLRLPRVRLARRRPRAGRGVRAPVPRARA